LKIFGKESDMNPIDRAHEAQPASQTPKRPYCAPSLRAFGRISTLTQSASGCNASDNASCVGAATGNMGPLPHLRR
jgi:hypothetical protein